MNLLEFLQLLFCCMFPMCRRRRTNLPFLFPWVNPLSKSIRSRSRPRQGRDGPDFIVYVRSRANYQELRAKIFNGINFDTSTTLYVMCSDQQVSNDYVSTMMNQYGEVRELLDKWVKIDGISTWAGAVVTYSSDAEALCAAKDLPLRCRHIRALPIADILSVLADFELLRTWSNYYTCTVLISARGELSPSHANDIIYNLYLCGAAESLLINNQIFSRRGCLCRATYPFLTQGYLAMMMTNGMQYGDCLVSARLAEDALNDEILEDARIFIREKLLADVM